MELTHDNIDETPVCRSVICPLNHFRGCEWRGSSEAIMEHCLAKHEKYVRKGYKQTFMIENFTKLKVLTDFPHVIEAHGNIFLLWLRKFPSGILSVRMHSMKCCMKPFRYIALITFYTARIVRENIENYPYFYHFETDLNDIESSKTLFNNRCSNRFFFESDHLEYTIHIKDKHLRTILNRV